MYLRSLFATFYRSLHPSSLPQLWQSNSGLYLCHSESTWSVSLCFRPILEFLSLQTLSHPFIDNLVDSRYSELLYDFAVICDGFAMFHLELSVNSSIRLWSGARRCLNYGHFVVQEAWRFQHFSQYFYGFSSFESYCSSLQSDLDGCYTPYHFFQIGFRSYACI